MPTAKDVWVGFLNGKWVVDYLTPSGASVEAVVGEGADITVGDLLHKVMIEIQPYDLPDRINFLLPNGLEAHVSIKSFAKLGSSFRRRRISDWREDEQRWLSLGPEEIKEMPEEEFLKAVNDVVWQILELEKALKPLKKTFLSLDKHRLYEYMLQYDTKIVELQDVVLRLKEASDPRINWAAVVEELIKARPELKSMVEDIKTAQKASSKPPKRTLVKFQKEDEPKLWRVDPDRVKLSFAEEDEIDEVGWARLLQAHLQILDRIIASLKAAMQEEALPRAASLRRLRKTYRRRNK